MRRARCAPTALGPNRWAGDGDKIVSASRDGSVRVWDVERGRMRYMLQGFTTYIGSVQLSPSYLVADGTRDRIMMFSFDAGGDGQLAEGD